MDAPPGLRQLVQAYESRDPGPVRYRPSSWPAGATSAWLQDESRGVRTADRGEPGDRLIDADSLRRVCSGLDPKSSDAELLAAFGLVMAWGSGTSALRSYRNLAAATQDARLIPSLRETLNLCRGDDTTSLRRAYERWQVAGVRRSYFTKWFSFAGRRQNRNWQPLILDDRVLNTLSRSLGVTTRKLAGSPRWGQRYVAYVEALHAWATHVGSGTTPERLEWVMFCHNGSTDLHRPSSRC
jgi:hypothetical protein